MAFLMENEFEAGRSTVVQVRGPLAPGMPPLSATWVEVFPRRTKDRDILADLYRRRVVFGRSGTVEKANKDADRATVVGNMKPGIAAKLSLAAHPDPDSPWLIDHPATSIVVVEKRGETWEDVRVLLAATEPQPEQPYTPEKPFVPQPNSPPVPPDTDEHTPLPPTTAAKE